MTTSISTTLEPAAGLLAVPSLELNSRHLLDLAEGKCSVIRVPDLISPEALNHVQAVLVEREDHGPLNYAPEFRRIGLAFTEVRDEASEHEYFSQARQRLARTRALVSPFPWPSDQVRTLLDEAWPAGAHLARLKGRPFSAGVIRYQTPGVDLEPHTDRIDRNLPESMANRIASQLSVNVHIALPDEGGELELWNIRPDEEQYRALQGDRIYGLDRDLVGDPDFVVKPQPGDVFILDPTRIHAVRPAPSGRRVTIGHFIGLVDELTPLDIWS